MRRGSPPQSTEKTSLNLPSIGIPGEVLFHTELSETEKILFGILQALAQTEDGCWASNKFLSLRIGKKEQTVVNAIAKLKKWKFITAEYSFRPDGAQIRHVFINPTPKHILKYLYPINIFIDPPYKNINSNIREDKEEKETSLPLCWKDLSQKFGQARVRFTKRFLDAQKKNWPKKIKGCISPNSNQILGSLDCLDKLCRIDKFDFEKDIRPILEQVPDHEFWSGVILSLSTLRNKSKNGETKFVNLCISIERDIRSAPPSKQQLMNWYEATQQRPSDKELRCLRDSEMPHENHQAQRWSQVPSAKKLVREYEAWLDEDEQNWIEMRGAGLFKPTGKIFQSFLAQYQKDLGVDFITGRNIQ